MDKTVIVNYISKFSTKVDGVNKKLKRAKRELITWEKIGETRFQEDIWGYMIHIEDGAPLRNPFAPVYYKDVLNVHIPEVEIVVPGWEFIAKIEFMAEGNMVLQPGYSLPGVDYTKFVTIKPFCHHCNSRRPRTKSLIFRNTTTGDEIQLGTSCASVYFGMDLDKTIDHFEVLANFTHDLSVGDDDDEEWGNRCKKSRVLFTTRMEAGLYLIRKYGYISRRAADDRGGLSTVDHADMLVNPDSDPDGYIRGDLDFRSDKELRARLAEDVQRFISEVTQYDINTLNDFERNAVVAIKNSSEKYLSFAIPYMNNFFKVKTEQANPTPKTPSVHLGAKGDKVSFTGTVTVIKDISNYYDTFLVGITGSNGEKVVWFASSRPDSDINTGDQVQVSARIKSVGEYNGEAQTVITRAYMTKVG